MQLPTGSHVAVADGTQFQLFRNSGTEQDPSLKAVDLPTSDEAAHNAGQGDTPRQNDEAGHAASVAEALNAAGAVEQDQAAGGDRRSEHARRDAQALSQDARSGVWSARSPRR